MVGERAGSSDELYTYLSSTAVDTGLMIMHRNVEGKRGRINV
jgi:hypothetical protein